MLTVSHLTRRYGSFLALDDVSLTAAKGEILGLLGPNGAGKSTAMKVIAGHLAADEGEVALDNIEVHARPLAFKARVGYMPEHLPLYDEMEVGEYLEFCAAARGMTGARRRERLAAMVNACALQAVYRQPIATLSRGYRQRVGLAQALLHEPRLLVADEPTAGLDPHQIVGIHRLLRELAARGVVVVFSTHILSEIETLADRTAIMNRGRLAALGSVKELAATAGLAGLIELRLNARPSQALLDALKRCPAIVSDEAAAGTATVLLRPAVAADADEATAALYDLLRRIPDRVLSLTTRAPSLADIFFALVKPETPTRKVGSAPLEKSPC